MEQDSLKYDSAGIRPLPGWLKKQKDGLNTYQPEKSVIKEDNSLLVSFAFTGIFVVLFVSIITVYILRKSRNKK